MAAGSLVASSPLLAESSSGLLVPLSDLPPVDDPAIKALMEVALNTAKAGGASYADVRVAARRQQNVGTRDRIVQGVSDTDTYGLGVRTLVDGAWGFAATSKLDRDSVARTTQLALGQAKANRASQLRPVVLAPTPGNQVGEWKSPIKVDPFNVPITDKVAFLLAANEAALKVKGVRNVNSSMFFLREEKSLMTTDGSYVVQTIYRAQPSMNITAVSSDFSDFQSVASNEVAPMGLGYEHVTNSRLAERAPEWGELAVQKLSAKPVEPGRYDLLLHPSNLWLTIHEVIGHPTELDRALGFEANYAGTSFIAPPEAMLGKMQYGSELMNIVGDREQQGSLGAIGWDDEAVRPVKFDIVKNGVFQDYQTTREQADDGRLLPARGQARALVRLLVCAELGRCAVPAYAQRESAARQQRRHVGIDDRQGRSWHRDRGRRIVLHRSAALQRPVRGPGVLRGARRQDRRSAEGRGVPVPHAGFLEGTQGHRWPA